MQDKEKRKENNQLLPKSEAFLEMLENRGLIKSRQITDEKIRCAKKEKTHRMYHNTELLLKHYRDITWMLECFPAEIAEELEHPLKDIDMILSLVNNEIDMDNRKLENRLANINKSRMLIDLIHEALAVLRKKPDNGQLMYNIIYDTYIIPEKLPHMQLIYRLNISTRHYYRLRKQAFHILSLCLWSSPGTELDSWIEILAVLKNI